MTIDESNNRVIRLDREDVVRIYDVLVNAESLTTSLDLVDQFRRLDQRHRRSRISKHLEEATNMLFELLYRNDDQIDSIIQTDSDKEENKDE